MQQTINDNSMRSAHDIAPNVPGGRSRRWDLSGAGWNHLLVLPSLLMIVFFLGLPLVVIFIESFQDNVLLQFSSPGIENYQYLLTRDYYFSVLARTFRMSVYTTLFTVPLGYLTAMALPALNARLANLALMALTFPILAGPLVIILGWMALLPNSGPVFGALVHSGWIAPPNILGSEAAIVIAQIQYVLPFAVLTLCTALRQIPMQLYEASAAYGAGEISTFFHVTLPLSLPGVLSTTIIVFSLAASSFIAPHYLGGPGDVTLTTLITNFVFGTFNGPLAATASIVLLAMMLLSMVAIIRIFGLFIRP